VSSPAPAFSEFRPLSTGELMDRAVAFWRSHWKPLFQLYLAFQLAAYALLKLLLWAMRVWFPLLQDGLALASALKNDPTEVVRQSVIGVATIVPIFTVYAWVLWIASIAGARYVIGECLGQKPSPAGSIRYAFARLGAATRALILLALLSTAVCLLSGLALSVVVIFASVVGAGGGALSGTAGVLIVLMGGAVGFFAFALGFLWYVLRFLLIAPVLAVEDLSAVASIQRSGQLMSGKIGPGVMNGVKVRATVLITAMMLVVLVVTSLGAIPSMVLTFAYAKHLNVISGGSSTVPELFLIPAELFHVGVQSLFAPLYIALASIFYLDMRVRREGLDLELKLDALRGGGAR
jgi:hypothetical protein